MTISRKLRSQLDLAYDLIQEQADARQRLNSAPDREVINIAAEFSETRGELLEQLDWAIDTMRDELQFPRDEDMVLHTVKSLEEWPQAAREEIRQQLLWRTKEYPS